MPVDAVTGERGVSQTGQALAGSRQLGQQEFLKLLVTQLTNQNPLNPQDDREFIAQMAQFSAVEGVAGISRSMESLQAAGLLGWSVDAARMEMGGLATFSGQVQEVVLRRDGARLVVGDREVRLHDIVAVRKP